MIEFADALYLTPTPHDFELAPHLLTWLGVCHRWRLQSLVNDVNY